MEEPDGWICTPPAGSYPNGGQCVVHRSTDGTTGSSVVEIYRSKGYTIKPFWLRPAKDSK